MDTVNCPDFQACEFEETSPATAPTPKVSTDLSSIKVPRGIHTTAKVFREACMTASRIAERDLSCESMLMTLKWFDYRFMTPAAATQKFKAAFERIYRQMNRKYTGRDHQMIRADLWHLPDDLLVTLWRGRQYADSLCMKYDKFIKCVMKYWFEQREDSSQELALADLNQLFSIPALISAERWWVSHAFSPRLERSTLPQYRIRNETTLESVEGRTLLVAQVDHVIWLLSHLSEWPPARRPPELAKLVYIEKTLTEVHCLRMFGIGALMEAKLLSMSNVVELKQPRRVSFIPPCFGLPNASSRICSDCQATDECGSDAQKAAKIASSLKGQLSKSKEIVSRMDSFILHRFEERQFERHFFLENYLGTSV